MAQSWWAGVQPAKLMGFELVHGRKAQYNGTLNITLRAGLKDNDATKEWGLYYREPIGRRLWIPFRIIKKIELGEADVHRSGIGLIGFGPIGIAGVLAANAANRHRAKAVRVLSITDGGKTHVFQTKANMQRVAGAFGPMLRNYAAALEAQAQAANLSKLEAQQRHDAEAEVELARLREEAEERRREEIREQAQVIAAAVSSPQISIADELTKLAGLRDSGILTEAEFSAQKAKLLS